jgi:hypothetical protein
MFIDTIPNRKSPPAVLLRESYREGGRVKKRTLANLSKLPQALIEGIVALLDGGKVSGKREAEAGFDIVRSLPSMSAIDFDTTQWLPWRAFG